MSIWPAFLAPCPAPRKRKVVALSVCKRHLNLHQSVVREPFAGPSPDRLECGGPVATKGPDRGGEARGIAGCEQQVARDLNEDRDRPMRE